MDILMIGGTGTISYDATRYFLEKGHNVFLLNRGHRNDLRGERLSYIIGNANDYNNLSSVLNGRTFDVIIDFIIYNRTQMEKRSQIYANKCKQFVFISSATVYKPTDEILTEDSPLGNNEWSYSREKQECEDYLRENAGKGGFIYTIVRPYITYDSRRLPFPVITKGKYYSLLDRIQKQKPVILCGDGSNKLTLTHTSDFAVALEGLLMNPKAENQAFHISGDCVTNWNEILDIICKRLGKKADVVYIPVRDLARYYPSESRELLYDKAGDHVFSNKKICDAVPAFKTTLTIEVGISQTVDHLLHTNSLQQVDGTWNDIIDTIIEMHEKKQGALRHPAAAKSKRNYRRSQTWMGILFHKVEKKLGLCR